MPIAHFAPEDAYIAPVKDLRVGDQVRDFYSKAPTFGLVTNTADDHALVLWEDERYPKPMTFKDTNGKRCDIIRRKREDELEGPRFTSAEFLAHPSHAARGKVDKSCGLCKTFGATPVRWGRGNIANGTV